MGDREQQAAFARCIGLLRRGIVSGGDVTEYLRELASATGAVGLSLASGFRFAERGAVRDLPREWPARHAAFQHEDPSPQWLDANGPLAIYSVQRATPRSAWRRSALLDAFQKSGFRDGAITRIGSARRGWLYLAAYRPRPLPDFEDDALARLTALLPWMDLAFAPGTAQQALEAPPSETQREALRRLAAYAVVDPVGREPTYWSRPARALLAEALGSFEAHAERRVERVVREAQARFVAGRGGRSVRVHARVVVELGLHPRAGKDAAILATFSEQRPPRATDELGAPFEALLSPRQRLVARAAADGASLPTIAALLALKPDTVKDHVREIYRRLGVGLRAELAAMYANREP